jgi:hypothetical protein
MKKMPVILFLFFALHLFGKSYYSVTEKTQISLLTTSPGQELYATFGHSAIRIKDTVGAFDLVFNYGSFDFEEPYFYWHFIKGKLNYSLVIVKAEDFISGCKQEDRSVCENILHLDSTQKQKLFDYLMWNAELENRDYKYDFFYNNCATRIRDVFEAQSGNSLSLDYSNIAFRRKISKRKMLDLYLSQRPWAKLGLYLILGSPSDIDATPQSQVFLPDQLKVAFVNGTNAGTPLAGSDRVMYGSSHMQGLITTPQSWFDITFVIPISIALMLIGFVLLGRYQVVTFIMLLLTGSGGLFFIFMWLGTDLESTYKNLNLLWALPWNFVAAFLMLTEKYRNAVSSYIRIYGYWLLLLFFLSFVLPQPFHISVLMSILVIGVFYSSGISKRNPLITISK